MTDIEDIKTSNLTVRDIYKFHSKEMYKKFIHDMIIMLNDIENPTQKDFNRIKTMLKKKHHIAPSTVSANYTYFNMVQNNLIKRCYFFENFNKGKMCRTSSGITQVTVLSSAYPNGKEFSCEHNCYYCPNEPAHKDNNFVAQPRSYLYNEPAVRRANSNGFDACLQMWDRMSSLMLCGLSIDKLEVMVLGGTWGSYPKDYRYEFIRDLYYAANTFYIDNGERREKLSLIEEQVINETAYVRIIGLTLETRPDHVTAEEILLLNKYNCTRVQIGIQHINDRILKKINRGCYYKDGVRAIKNLLDCGFKVDIHLMFDLPYASVQDDMEMIDNILYDDDMRFDQAKLYPFASLDWTVTKQWEDKGEVLHYSDEELIDVIIYAKSKMPPWVRLNRIIRDIPEHYIHAGNKISNLRQHIHVEMEKMGLSCACIRCREVKNKIEAIDAKKTMKMFIRNYTASYGQEYFISFESADNKYIYGFCRLRLSKNMGYVKDIKPAIHRQKGDIEREVNIMPWLNNCAMIRELHVYGNMTRVDTENNHTQHQGLGKKLIREAENIAINNGYYKIAVISGVGVRKYYEKFNYRYSNNYMIKDLSWNVFKYILFCIMIVIMINVFINLIM
jgi:ELP3 family radical SAM enzyme/protein acetyltransferase